MEEGEKQHHPNGRGDGPAPPKRRSLLLAQAVTDLCPVGGWWTCPLSLGVVGARALWFPWGGEEEGESETLKVYLADAAGQTEF